MAKNGEKITIALLNQKVDYVVDTVKSIERKLEEDYVTQDQFDPVKKVVYGLVGIILTAVIGALVALVVIK